MWVFFCLWEPERSLSACNFSTNMLTGAYTHTLLHFLPSSLVCNYPLFCSGRKWIIQATSLDIRSMGSYPCICGQLLHCRAEVQGKAQEPFKVSPTDPASKSSLSSSLPSTSTDTNRKPFKSCSSLQNTLCRNTKFLFSAASPVKKQLQRKPTNLLQSRGLDWSAQEACTGVNYLPEWPIPV